ncbi:hypothetical protein LOAG_12987 [Loa loa]|uniref:Uncharacterized protein n=2 Tax=Loa loa TaxID=7209 RepID=A0A1S0TKS5_LOALO|nr:hypothetical protein LOAG_12987 [Loa loa]EFO15523.2 hypothetical protein LOAG_12987 [Loa loa]
MNQQGPSRVIRKESLVITVSSVKEPLVITVPRGLLRRSLQEIIPNKNLRVGFVVSGSEIKILSPSEKWDFDLSHVQHLPQAHYYTGFRNLRSPSPPICHRYDFSTYGQYAASRPPICPPEHGRYLPTPLSPRYARNPFPGPPPNSIYIPFDEQLPRNRKVTSKLARRRGVHIDPLTGKVTIFRRRTHSKQD